MKNKHSLLLLIVVVTGLLVISVSLMLSHISWKTVVFSSLPSDGRIEHISHSYGEVRNATDGRISDKDYWNWLGQANDSDIAYAVFRVFLFFDTSSIPENAIITSATLSIKVYVDLSSTDFNLTIQNGDVYPSNPLKPTDYYYGHYTGIGGIFDTSHIRIGYNNITLNQEGIKWINREGITKFCLRSSRDINNIPPKTWECVELWMAEAGENYTARLYVTYVGR